VCGSASQGESILENNTVTQSVTVTKTADLTLSKNAKPDPVDLFSTYSGVGHCRHRGFTESVIGIVNYATEAPAGKLEPLSHTPRDWRPMIRVQYLSSNGC